MPVRIAAPEDGESIAEIYRYYVRNSSFTFEVEAPSSEEMRNRIKSITAVYPWFVFEENNDVK